MASETTALDILKGQVESLTTQLQTSQLPSATSTATR